MNKSSTASGKLEVTLTRGWEQHPVLSQRDTGKSTLEDQLPALIRVLEIGQADWAQGGRTYFPIKEALVVDLEQPLRDRLVELIRTRPPDVSPATAIRPEVLAFDNIARAAGVSTRTLYNYFGDKAWAWTVSYSCSICTSSRSSATRRCSPVSRCCRRWESSRSALRCLDGALPERAALD